MTRTTMLAGLLLVIAAAPVAAQAGVTLYSDGRVLVRRTLPIQVPQGTSVHRLALGPLDPGSVFSLDPDLFITGTSFDAAVDEANTMRRAIGRKLVFETGGRTNGVLDTVVAEVLGVEPERVRLADGRILFARPGRPRYPDDLVQLAPTLAVGVRSTAPRNTLSLGYFTDGASWSAAYQVILARGVARITGQAVMPSQRLSVDDADVQLLAGDIGAARPASPYAARMMESKMAADAVGGVAAEQQIGESHLYSLPGRLTLRPGVTTTAALFEQTTAPWERVYTVRGQVPWYGPLGQDGGENKQPVEVHYLIKRPRPSEFGDRPLPAGGWRIYEADASGRLQLVGEAGTGHSAAGQDLRLAAGTAFDLTATRVQTDYAIRRDSTRTIATAGYRVTLANAKDSVVSVDVLEERRGEWRILESSLPAEKLSSTQTRFRMRVPARGEVVLTYRVRVVW